MALFIFTATETKTQPGETSFFLFFLFYFHFPPRHSKLLIVCLSCQQCFISSVRHFQFRARPTTPDLSPNDPFTHNTRTDCHGAVVAEWGLPEGGEKLSPRNPCAGQSALTSVQKTDVTGLKNNDVLSFPYHRRSPARSIHESAIETIWTYIVRQPYLSAPRQRTLTTRTTRRSAISCRRCSC